MKIFDCFTFNNELDILEFRLGRLHSTIDKFVLIESRQTHTGHHKPLYFQESRSRFKLWEDKICYFECTLKKGMDYWTYENYQRDFIRECLSRISCDDEDIVFISDVDEIVNIEHVLNARLYPPFRIEMPFYYYFTNLRASEMWDLVVCCQWKHIKNQGIGNRLKYREIFPILLNDSENKNGGHFSYLFGYSITKYKKKIESFAHSEYNNFYFKNSVRLKYCISNRLDIYERSWIKFEVTNTNSESFIVKGGIIETNAFYTLPLSSKDFFLIKSYIFFIRLIYRILRKVKFLNK